jgi:undecaprenyl diphosphate synthase
MSHLTSTSIPAPVSRAAASSVSEAPAPAATVRSGPQPAISRPRHLALVPENTPTSHATALAWIDALTQAIDGCAAQGVEELSVFVCAKTSSGSETLLNAIRSWLCGYAAALARSGIGIDVIGEPDAATAEAVRFATRAANETRASEKLRVHLAIGYDGRAEVAGAARALAREAALHPGNPDLLTPEALKRFLPTAALPPVDLLVRTGGETRLSHFLMWQTAYAELLFVASPWIGFTAQSVQNALADFAQRRRTFGGLNQNCR